MPSNRRRRGSVHARHLEAIPCVTFMQQTWPEKSRASAVQKRREGTALTQRTRHQRTSLDPERPTSRHGKESDDDHGCAHLSILIKTTHAVLHLAKDTKRTDCRPRSDQEGAESSGTRFVPFPMIVAGVRTTALCPSRPTATPRVTSPNIDLVAEAHFQSYSRHRAASGLTLVSQPLPTAQSTKNLEDRAALSSLDHL